MNLRDHSQPCEHAPDDYMKVWGDGFHIGHDYQWAPAHGGWCSGGREVTIHYGAMLAVYDAEWRSQRAGMAGDDWERLRRELEAAAIGTVT